MKLEPIVCIRIGLSLPMREPSFHLYLLVFMSVCEQNISNSYEWVFDETSCQLSKPKYRLNEYNNDFMRTLWYKNKLWYMVEVCALQSTPQVLFTSLLCVIFHKHQYLHNLIRAKLMELALKTCIFPMKPYPCNYHNNVMLYKAYFLKIAQCAYLRKTTVNWDLFVGELQ